MKFDVTQYDGWKSNFASWDGIEAESAVDAAEQYLERNFVDLEYPNECDVIVRSKVDGKHTKVTVECEPVPVFFGRNSIEIDPSVSSIKKAGAK